MREIVNSPRAVVPLSLRVRTPGSTRRQPRLRRICLALALLLLSLTAWGEPDSVVKPGGPRDLEYQVKAAFLFNLAKFVTWPEDVLGPETDEFCIGIVGPDPFQGFLEENTSDRSIQGRGIVIKKFATRANLEPCHVLFINYQSTKDLTGILKAVDGTPVLTVGDARKFLGLGGMVLFTEEDDKVRFEVSLEPAKQARLKFNSKLLGVARRVR